MSVFEGVNSGSLSVKVTIKVTTAAEVEEFKLDLPSVAPNSVVPTIVHPPTVSTDEVEAIKKCCEERGFKYGGEELEAAGEFVSGHGTEAAAGGAEDKEEEPAADEVEKN